MFEKGRRVLAAIMFADMEGYTALMQKDEARARANRDRYRQVLESAIDTHNGEVVQYYGDGALSIFESSIEAVRSAIKIQSELQSEPKIPLRIGLHSGDIVYDDDGIYGDGVNIASRIESLSVPGGVLISERVYDDIKNHADFETNNLGIFELKNVRRPIEVFALCNKGLIVPKSNQINGKGQQQEKSIAVMPFVNMSADPDNEYFSDGITEEIINALTKVEGLRVASRTSSFSFKGKNQDVREIGNQLNVQHVIEGSVRKAGNKVRVTAQLINTHDGYHAWSENFDRQLEDIFELQDELSSKIAQNLREKLSLKEANKSLVVAPTKDIEAYNLYLQGLFHYNKWTAGSAAQSIAYFEKAIEREPDFAPAYANMASAYVLVGTTGQADAHKSMDLAREACRKALKLDSTIVEAYTALSFIQFFYDWDLDSARNSILKALAINPNHPDARLSNGLYHLVMGDTTRAIEEIETGLKTDPLSLQINRALADTFYFAGMFDRAIAHYDKTLQIDPSYRAAVEFKGWTYLLKGDYDTAIGIFHLLGEETTHAMKPHTQLAYAYARKGDQEKALEYLELLKQDKDQTMNIDFATVYAGLEDLDNAFLYLHKSIEDRIGMMIFLNISPVWEPIKHDSRFDDLLREVGLK